MRENCIASKGSATFISYPVPMQLRAVVVGSGPNGLAGAIALAQAGVNVTVVEAEETIGGGMRSAELTLPGFTHDICSAVHPMAVASPFLRSLHLERRGLEWIHPDAPLAHPLDDGTAVMLERSVESTANALGPDARAYRSLFAPLVREAPSLLDSLLKPLFPPRHPLALARFGLLALRSASGLSRSRFRGERARALFAGLAAHSLLSLDAPGSASFGLVLGMTAHAWGGPVARGGSQRIADALAAELTALGGSIITGKRVMDDSDLAGTDVVMFDTSPRVLVSIAGDRLQRRYTRNLLRYRDGPGVFKVDWALSEPRERNVAEGANTRPVALVGGVNWLT